MKMSPHSIRPLTLSRQPAPIAKLFAISLIAASCASARTHASVQIAVPMTVVPFVVHGSCLAGWIVTASLRIEATEDLTLKLESVHISVKDPVNGETVDSGILDLKALQANGSLVGDGVVERGKPITVALSMRGFDPAVVRAQSTAVSLEVSGSVVTSGSGTEETPVAARVPIQVTPYPLPLGGACPG